MEYENPKSWQEIRNTESETEGILVEFCTEFSVSLLCLQSSDAITFLKKKKKLFDQGFLLTLSLVQNQKVHIKCIHSYFTDYLVRLDLSHELQMQK